jgi:5-methylcytosine-specific restriction endonuclease McrA/predicted kinase
LVQSGASRCAEHRAVSNQRRDEQRGSSTERGYGATWQKIRRRILANGPLCADPFGFHADAEEVVLAADVDHIMPKHQGGTDADDNLQPLCKRCHALKTEETDTPWLATRYMKARVPVTIVTGAPGSGKTTYVKERASWGDLIIDLDAIYVALSGLPWYEKPDVLLPFVLTVRDALLRRLSKESKIRHAWVITSEARQDVLSALSRGLGAEVIVMDVSPTECILRISRDERRRDKWQLWQPIVDRWFKRAGVGAKNLQGAAL